MRILIFGKNGQVGKELQRFFSREKNVLALGREDEGGDLTNLDSIENCIHSYRPDLVFNAAAYTKVDKAESERELARLVNARAVGVMAKACEEIGAVFVHYSTDYVFDGKGNNGRTEDDIPQPINFYGVTKLEGEDAIRATNVKALIFRTSWCFASCGHNFIRTILSLAKSKHTLNVVSDQIGVPTSAIMIAEVSGQLGVRTVGGEKSLCGLYNLVPHGETSWYDLACYVINFAERLGFQQTLRASGIKAISSDDYPTSAERPLNSRLNNNKICSVYDGEIRHWQFYVDDALRSIFKWEK